MRIEPVQIGVRIIYHAAQGVLAVFVREHLAAEDHLFSVVQATDALRPHFCVAQCWQQQRRQNGNDGDDHEQFNGREAPCPVHPM